MKSLKLLKNFFLYSGASSIGFATDMLLISFLYSVSSGQYVFLITLLGYAVGSTISFLLLNFFVFTNAKRQLVGRITYFSATATSRALLVSLLTTILEKMFPLHIILVRVLAGIPVATFFFFIDNFVSFKNEIQ